MRSGDNLFVEEFTQEKFKRGPNLPFDTAGNCIDKINSTHGIVVSGKKLIHLSMYPSLYFNSVSTKHSNGNGLEAFDKRAFLFELETGINTELESLVTSSYMKHPACTFSA